MSIIGNKSGFSFIYERSYIHISIIIIIIFLGYLNTLDSPFYFDDSQIISFSKNYIGKENLSLDGLVKYIQNSPNKWRIIPKFTFALNVFFNGENVYGYHILNIAIHVVVSLVLYFLFLAVFDSLSLFSDESIRCFKKEIAFFSTLIWALHPVQTNVVTYIVQRMTSLAALFYLLSFLFYLKGKLSISVNIKISFYIFAVISSILAIFSKENAAILPLTIFFSEYFFFKNDIQSHKHLDKRGLLTGLFVILVLSILTITFLGNNPIEAILNGYNSRNFTLYQRLITEPRIIFYYLSLIILPLPSRLNIAYDYNISTGIISPPHTLLAILGIIFLCLSIFLLFKKNRLLSFTIFWFLINLIIESTFIPLMLIFEHRIYLPSVFIFLFFVFYLYKFGKKHIHYVRLFLICIVFASLIFTIQRNVTWSDKVSLWSDVIQKSPGLSWGYINLGKAYTDMGNYPNAEKYLMQGVQLDPQSGFGYFNLGVLFSRQNRHFESIQAFEKALALNYNDPVSNGLVVSNLAYAHYKSGNLTEAISLAGRAVELDPGLFNAYDVLGVSYLQQGKTDRAETVFLDTLRKFPDNEKAYRRLASVYVKQKRLHDSLKILENALALPGGPSAKVYNQLGIVYWQLNHLPESIASAKKAIELDPGFIDAYLTLGISYEDSGKRLKAFAEFEEAWRKGYDMVSLYNKWAKHFIEMGDAAKAILYLEEATKLEPSRLEIHKNLVEAYTMQGMAKKAAAEMNKIERLGKSNYR